MSPALWTGEERVPDEDSREGARRTLAREISWSSLDSVEFVRDPRVPGCWAALLPDSSFGWLVYVGKHPDAPGIEPVEFEGRP